MLKNPLPAKNAHSHRILCRTTTGERISYSRHTGMPRYYTPPTSIRESGSYLAKLARGGFITLGADTHIRNNSTLDPSFQKHKYLLGRQG